MNHPRNKTRFKSLNRLAAHEAVEEIWDEGDDGLWLSLNKGWYLGGGAYTTCIHEHNVKNMIEQFKLIEKGEIE